MDKRKMTLTTQARDSRQVHQRRVHGLLKVETPPVNHHINENKSWSWILWWQRFYYDEA